MLACPGNGNGNVKVRGHGFSGEAYLKRVGEPPCVTNGPARTDSAPKDLCQFFELLERLWAAKSSATRDDNRRVL